jgi:ubiquinone/menaquinone biosynthesis C-methylase UbiE
MPIEGNSMNDAATLFTDGKAYERIMGRWSKLVGDKFVDWIGAPKGLRWLDVGCGNGAFTEVLISRCAPAAVTGVDASDGQLAYARTRPGAMLAEFRIAQAQDLPFADDSFDAASMALVITFLPDPDKAAAEMARVVRPGGIVATYMWDMAAGGIPLAPVGRAMKSLGMTTPTMPNMDASRQENMRTIWQHAGLTAVETGVIRIPVVYADFDDFWGSNSAPVGTSGKALADLSPAAREAVKARLREQLPIAADGRIAYEGFANAVKGRVPA